MSSSEERENSNTVSIPSVTTPLPDVSTPSTSSYSQTSNTQSSTPPCPNPYQCGQDNHEIKSRLLKLENRISNLEETASERRSFLKKAESLLVVFKVVLIAIPIILSIAIAITLYFVYNDSRLLNVVTGVIGIVTIAECVLLPILWKSVESRLKEVEEYIKEKQSAFDE